MTKINFKKILFNSTIILVIFLIDRISKTYILKIAELENTVDIYLTPYLNLYLIWNKGIAFGLLSVNESFVYNSISGVIALIILIVLVMLIKSHGLKRYSLTFVLGGSVGNLFDRIYYTAVPDFIDLHINNLHWFIFNVADIFITTGIICLIYVEIFFDKEKNENH
jgi:signal peptidase II|tara:strand:+ start:403 stop:900 length:498 start_codon:yes stop_codon:yes gene_type:complete